MSDIQMTIASERWLDEVLLTGSWVNLDADRVDELILPATIGDVAVMEMEVSVNNIGTYPTSLLKSVRALIVMAGSVQINDIIGTEEFREVGAGYLSAYISPDPLVIWRQSERLQLVFPELDVNVTPTADATVRVKVVRVSAVDTAVGGPIRLVR